MPADWRDKCDLPWEELLAEQEFNYENSVCKKILEWSGRTKRAGEVRDYTAQVLDTPRLTFYAMCHVIGFPLLLTAKKFKFDPELDWELDCRFPSSRIYQAFVEAKDDPCSDLPDLPIGIVFRWPKRGDYKVLHDAQVLPEFGGPRRLWFVGQAHTKIWLTDLKDLVKELGDPDAWQ
jgi:hypothetical protein